MQSTIAVKSSRPIARLVTGHVTKKPCRDLMTEWFGHGFGHTVIPRRAYILCDLIGHPLLSLLSDAQDPLIYQRVTTKDILSIRIEIDSFGGLRPPTNGLSLLTQRKVIRLAIAAHRPACPFLCFAKRQKPKSSALIVGLLAWLAGWLACFYRLARVNEPIRWQDRSGGLVGTWRDTGWLGGKGGR
jgi:hypothetical protein